GGTGGEKSLFAPRLPGLPGRHGWLPTAAAQKPRFAELMYRDAPPPPAPLDTTRVYTYLEQMPQLPGGGGQAAMVAAIEQHLVLPAGTPEGAGLVFVKFVVEKNGALSNSEIVRGVGPVPDAAVLAAVRQLPHFEPGRHQGQLLRVSCTLLIRLPLAARQAAAQRQESETRAQEVAQRQPGEENQAFLRRVLPVAYPAANDLLAYAWRPSAFGKQLFFSAPASPGDYYKTKLFVLDPYQVNTYAVHTFDLAMSQECDRPPVLNALFFADLNQDGQKELLALVSCDATAPTGRDADGVGQFAYTPHYHTQVYQCVGLDNAGRPRYRPDPARRPYLQNLATVAAVRRALAQHAPPTAPIKAMAKPAKASK
ncbi:MAG: hypothetical protein EOO59_07820, partial [Hymenobacter sp.]